MLIVEDEQDIAGLIKHTLERGRDTDAEVVAGGDAALKAVGIRPPDFDHPRPESAEDVPARMAILYRAEPDRR